jgi:phage terminase small subunit
LGYSEKSAECLGFQLLQNPKVSSEIANDPRKQHGNGAKTAISAAYAISDRLQVAKKC